MRVFISQPMSGLDEMEVYAVRNKICNKFHITNSELIENYKKDFIPKKDVNDHVWGLGDSIKLMAFADLVIFAPGWKKARGCLIEHDICGLYDIPYIEV